MLLFCALLALAPYFCRNAAAMESEWRSEILHHVNLARGGAGLAPLGWSGRLAQAAASHAVDLQRCGKLAHEGCDGSGLPQRLDRAAYRYRAAAENLALCACDAEGVVRLWLDSEGHRRNLLNPAVTELGADTRVDTGDPRRALWVLVLGRE
ncbi:MAG: CAP domain-containing protein [Ferrovibrio sp.]|uniref:CAP domain-containing protein n=1 Tax=Ferrovibrio sp. TaxID=1917215 RepID=UPI00391C9BC1